MASMSISDPELLFLATVRILAALSLAPIFSHRSMPILARITLSLALAALLVAPGGVVPAAVAGRAETTGSGMGPFLLAVATEALLGLLLGFASSLAFWAVTMAGDLVALQMGFGFGGTVHPSLETSSGAMSQCYIVTANLIFLGIGGHRLLLRAVANTFVAAPPYALVVSGMQIERVVQVSASLFTGALQIALPVTGTLLLADAVLAFLSRVLPQMNAFVFGLPLKIAAGLLVLWVSLPAALLFMARWLTQSAANMHLVVK